MYVFHANPQLSLYRFLCGNYRQKKRYSDTFALSCFLATITVSICICVFTVKQRYTNEFTKSVFKNTFLHISCCVQHFFFLCAFLIEHVGLQCIQPCRDRCQTLQQGHSPWEKPETPPLPQNETQRQDPDLQALIIQHSSVSGSKKSVDRCLCIVWEALC